jgi:hypothetical protein
MTSVEAVQLTGLKAASLGELAEGLEKVDGSSIYHHTHRFYRHHSFLGPSDRSDFTLWLGDNLKEAALSERMGAFDLRDFGTIDGLREAFLKAMDPARPDAERWNRRVPPGLEFHFCRSTSLVFPAGPQAGNLEEFQWGVEQVDTSCLYFHMIEAPIHFHGAERRFANDFSQWLAEAGFSAQAQALGDLDPYQGDLESLRGKILGVFQKGRFRASVRRAADRLGREASGEAAASWLQRWRRGE